MTYKEALEYAYNKLKESGIETYVLDSQIILENAIKRDRIYLYTYPNKELKELELKEFKDALERRIKREPIAQIYHNKEFMGLDFYVDSNVLTPRPDTEILVEEVLEKLKKTDNKKVLDLCCGSGAIGLSLKRFCPEAELTLSDISKEALSVTKRNAKNLKLKVNIICSDLYNQLNDSFDIIVSNPPYIRREDIKDLEPEIKDWEPSLALDGGLDGYDFYKSIICQSKQFLNKNGSLFLEIGDDQAKEVKKLLENNSFKEIKIIKDLSGSDRVVWAQI